MLLISEHAAKNITVKDSKAISFNFMVTSSLSSFKENATKNDCRNYGIPFLEKVTICDSPIKRDKQV